jgi:Ssp1 endopeptidase immunity protein Rap1a
MNKVVMAAVVLLLSAAAYADQKEHPRVWISGSDLAAQCSQILDQFSIGACAGYVVAAAEIADSGHLKGYRSCIPKDITKGQLQDVVNKHLAKHPEQLEYIGYQVVVVALVEAFPCSDH